MLADWSTRHDHLREVTRDEIVAVRDALQGATRETTIVALRSLFRFCKKTGRVFRDPTTRVHVARKPNGVLLPLETDDISQAVATPTTPADRVILSLAGIYAARPKSQSASSVSTTSTWPTAGSSSPDRSVHSMT